ncbi:uncharacterized protein LOC128302417 [Anopheles moucheti]|uniref:uncharacterized protein LOC128302417 n=1 Tax=Anopheles moucheti TaxID=186751 RepID=UPI0022F0550A|nr:uncharacterized protein LOC128302417 [Anopheles moucheti]
MSRRVVKTKNRWTTAQLEQLVTVWEKYYQQLKAGRGHEEIYEMMVNELKTAGCLEATVKQVRGRIHNLSGKFRKEASEFQRTGIPSQWSLYNKIANFFEYTAPMRYKNIGPPVYNMLEYLDMDIVMQKHIESRTSNRKRTEQYENPREFELDENSLDMEDDELEPDEDSMDVEGADQGEYSDNVQYDDENTADGFHETEGSKSDRPGEEKANRQEQSEPEKKSETKKSDTKGIGTVLDTDSSTDTDDDWSVVESSEQIYRKRMIHIKSSFRHAVIENFLSQLFSNQLYADVMLITCHEGTTCVLPAHRIVLANFSEFFSSILGALKPNTNGNPITICLQPDISQPVMQLLLQFMYTGKASIGDELMGDFVRCAQILRIRGVWTEEHAEFDEKRNKQPFQSSRKPSEAGRKTANESVSSSSSLDEERSTTHSQVTVIPQSSKDTGSDTGETSQRPTKRRKKLTKKAKRMREESDQKLENMEVSSIIGFDLLRSDTETEDNKQDVNEKQAERNDTGTKIKNVEDNAVDRFERSDYGKHDDDFDDEDEDDSEEDTCLDDEEADEECETEYIETETDTENAIHDTANEDSVSTTAVTITEPRPEQETAPTPEEIIELEKIQLHDRIEQNGNINGFSPHDEDSHESAPSHDEEELVREMPVSVNTNRQVQVATKPPDIHRKLKTVPSASRNQQSSLRQTNSQTTHSSKPIRQFNQQTYAKQSTSRDQFVPKARSVYSCKICGKRFNTSDGWVEHVVYEHSKDEQLTVNNSEEHLTMLQCDLCSKYLGSEYDWVHHILKKHTERYPHFHEELSMSDE